MIYWIFSDDYNSTDFLIDRTNPSSRWLTGTRWRWWTCWSASRPRYSASSRTRWKRAGSAATQSRACWSLPLSSTLSGLPWWLRRRLLEALSTSSYPSSSWSACLSPVGVVIVIDLWPKSFVAIDRRTNELICDYYNNYHTVGSKHST